MTLCGEERELLLAKCEDKCREVLGEDGEELWREIYIATAALTVRLDAVVGFAKGRPGVANKQEYLDTTCSEKFWLLIRDTLEVR